MLPLTDKRSIAGAVLDAVVAMAGRRRHRLPVTGLPTGTEQESP